MAMRRIYWPSHTPSLFEEAPFGVTGLETAFAVLNTRLVEPGVLPLATVVERMSTGPARIYGLEPPRIAVGAPANLVVRDLERTWCVHADECRSRRTNSWLIGATLKGKVDRTVAEYGRLDAAFNNGAIGQPPGPMDGLSQEAFDQVYAVNLRGVWSAIVDEVGAIRATVGQGSIVTTSSVCSFAGNPARPAYGAMKRAANSLTESAAITYGPENIRVNAIAPGTTMTEMLQDWDRATPGVIDALNAPYRT